MRALGAVLILSLCSTGFAAFAQQALNSSAPATDQTKPLTLDQILTNLEQNNQRRAAALQRFEGTRIYRMEYRGFPSDRDAAMTVKVTFQAPSSKQFTILSQSGSKFVIEHIFKKLLEGEQEAAKGENRNDTALTRRNYDFDLAGFEQSPQGDQYVLTLHPKNKNKYLYQGKIWVDAKDFAVVRIQGRARQESFHLDQEDRHCAQLQKSRRLLASRREPHRELDPPRRQSDSLDRISGLQDHQGLFAAFCKNNARQACWRFHSRRSGYLRSKCFEQPFSWRGRVSIASAPYRKRRYS